MQSAARVFRKISINPWHLSQAINIQSAKHLLRKSRQNGELNVPLLNRDVAPTCAWRTDPFVTECIARIVVGRHVVLRAQEPANYQ